MNAEEKQFLIDLRNRIDEFLRDQDSEEEIQVPEIGAYIEGNGIEVRWSPFETNKNVDLLYYAEEKHEPWEHSVWMYRGDVINTTTGGHRIGIKEPGLTWHVKLEIEGVFGEEVIADPEKKESEPITIIESTPLKGDWYGYISGVLKIGRKIRVYFEDRSNDWQVMYTESENLQEWSDPKPIGTTKQLWFVQHQGQIYAYGEDDDHMCIWRSDDGINHFSNRVKAFQWKLDTAFTLYFHTQNDEPRMFGRVRGGGGRDEGGWGNDHPDIDRRGISYHKAESIDGNWESRILADPMDYFDYDDDLQPDFYAPSFRPDGSGEIVIFWRDKNNAITKPDGSTRITGPIYPVPANYNNGEIHVLSYDPAVDISSFDHGDEAPHPGQVYIHPTKIEHDGQVWRVILRRSDEHYRKQANDTSGIYLVKEN